jgi:cell division protein ZipA
MAELRWILVVVGLAVLAGVYLWSRRRSGQSSEEPTGTRVEPRLEQEEDWPEDPLLPEPEDTGTPSGETGLLFEDLPVPGSEVPPPQPAAPPEKILVIHVRALREPGFPGPDLVAALEFEGLEYREPGVYVQLSDQDQPLFTVANMFEPGSIPREAPEDFVTRGITTFMVLPGPGSAETLARMVAMARRLAARLSGEVLDESLSTLTNQRATHMREEVIEFQRRSQISAGEY